MRRWIIHVLMGIVGASLGITTLPWVGTSLDKRKMLLIRKL
jgi:hypothetical protein